jgi:hypothetical protein
MVNSIPAFPFGAPAARPTYRWWWYSSPNEGAVRQF